MKNNEKNKQQSFISYKSTANNKTKDSINQDKTLDLSKSRTEKLRETAIENYDETYEPENVEEQLIKLEENEIFENRDDPHEHNKELNFDAFEKEAICFRLINWFF